MGAFLLSGYNFYSDHPTSGNEHPSLIPGSVLSILWYLEKELR